MSGGACDLFGMGGLCFFSFSTVESVGVGNFDTSMMMDGWMDGWGEGCLYRTLHVLPVSIRVRGTLARHARHDMLEERKTRQGKRIWDHRPSTIVEPTSCNADATTVCRILVMDWVGNEKI